MFARRLMKMNAEHRAELSSEWLARLDGAAASKPRRRRVALALGLLVMYVAGTSLAHYMLFPEGPSDSSDLPHQGVTIVNRGIHSRFVYRRTAAETGGRVFEWDNYVDPDGGPMDLPHVHPDTREIFEVVDGEIEFVVEGRIQIVHAGSTIVARDVRRT
jgi:mannose-6-phosphate isomerase-like protein (cupin superfamily)